TGRRARELARRAAELRRSGLPHARRALAAPPRTGVLAAHRQDPASRGRQARAEQRADRTRARDEVTRGRASSTSTSTVIAAAELGVACAPQQPARADLGFGRGGRVPIADAAGASGSSATRHAASTEITSGRAGSGPPLVTRTAQPVPSGFAVTFAVAP